MILSFLLLVFNLNQSAGLTSEVKWNEGATDCTLSFSFPAGTENRQVQYKRANDTDWTSIAQANNSGVVVLTSLPANQLYQARLVWTVEGEQSISEVHYFRTFANLASEPADYEHFKVLLPSSTRSFDAHPVYHGKVSFSYKDKYMSTGQLFGEITDLNNSSVAQFAMPKVETGIYHLDLQQLPYTWVLDENYSIKLYDDRNGAEWLTIRILNFEDELVPSVAANPISVNCEFEEASVIQYEGSIAGGVFPYEVSWLVEDVNRTTTLYGPVTSPSLKQGEVPTINVEFPLPYVVTMSLFDGCGRFAETSLIVSCSTSNDDGNSILIENVNNNDNQGGGTVEN